MDDVIGVDFDNTLVSYDDVIHQVAVERGLIHPGVSRNKREIRDRIRQLPDGENEWQRLQAVVYGPRMGEARLIDGVRMFFELCRQFRAKVFIISHKTEFAHFDETGTNLRTAAVAWMRTNGFFAADGLGLSQEDVYFEPTRLEKIERIRRLSCTHFIDDLEEVFLERSFPERVEKILYAPRRAPRSSLSGVKLAATWGEINAYFFHARA